MKRITFAFLFSLITFNGFSQLPYSNYWDFTSEWRNYSAGWDGIQSFAYYSTVYFDGYQVVNGISYYKEYTNQTRITYSWTGTTYTETSLYGPILTREDAAGNFYRISPGDGLEYLTFSNQPIIDAQLGDTYPRAGSTCQVESIETMSLGTRNLKRIKGSITGSNAGTLEGVGNIGNSCAMGIEGNGGINCYTKQNVTLQFGNIDCASFPVAHRTSLTVGNENPIRKFSIYPNPANGIFKIGMPETIENVAYEIFNINGSKIAKGKASPQENVDISSFSSGVYLVKIATANASEYLRIVKN